MIIDLAKSEWIENYKPSVNIGYFEGFYFSKIKRRMLIGVTCVFATQLCIFGSQIILDRYLTAYWRGGVISLTSSTSFVVLCFFIGKMSRNVSKNLLATSLVLLVLGLLVSLISEDKLEVPVIIASVLLRMLGSMGFGVLLIWAIETFPTVFRMMGASFVMAGGSIAGVLPYLFREHLNVQVWLMLGAALLALPFSYRMPDTLGEDLRDDLLLGQFW